MLNRLNAATEHRATPFRRDPDEGEHRTDTHRSLIAKAADFMRHVYCV